MSRQYPRGRISGDDDGALQMAIAHDPKTNTVIIKFAKPVDWIGLGPDEVEMLLHQLARHLSRMKGFPVALQLGAEDVD